MLKIKISFNCISIDIWFSSIDFFRDIFRNHHHIFVFDENTMFVKQIEFIIISVIYYIEIEKFFTTCLLFKYQWRHEMLAETWRYKKLFRLLKKIFFTMIFSIRRHKWKIFFIFTNKSHFNCISTSNVRFSFVNQIRRTSRLNKEYRRWLRKNHTRFVYFAVCKQIKQKLNSWFRFNSSIYQRFQISQRWQSRNHMFVVCKNAKRIARFDFLFAQRVNNH